MAGELYAAKTESQSKTPPSWQNSQITEVSTTWESKPPPQAEGYLRYIRPLWLGNRRQRMYQTRVTRRFLVE